MPSSTACAPASFSWCPEEDAAAFAALEAALLEELAPVGALQAVLAQRVVSAAWRLMRADRFEAEVLEFRRHSDGGMGLALIRDGNGTRSVETAMRYRNAATSELLRALKTLQTLQAPARTTEIRTAETRTARRNEPEQASRINASGDSSAARPPEGTTACAAPNPGKRRDLPGPRAAPDHLDAAPKSAPAVVTKRTQERPPNQRLDARAKTSRSARLDL